jgi:hypothetical protein
MDAHRREAKLNRRKYELLARTFVDQQIAMNAPCAQCGGIVDRDITLMSRIKDSGYFNHRDGGTLGHKIPVIDAPHLAHTQSNWQLEHRSCNSRDGQRIATTRRNATKRERPHEESHAWDWD